MKNTDIEKLKNDLDIIRVIEGEGIELKKSGKSYMGLCPFHNDKNPSLSVVTEKQMFKCFGCGASGDAIKFIQLKHSYNFKQAVEYLCKKYLHPHSGTSLWSKTEGSTHYYSTEKIPPPPVMNGIHNSKNLNDVQVSKLNVNDVHTDNENLTKLAEQYHSSLLQKQQALDYLKKRGITDIEIIKKFKIGYVNGYVTFPFFDEQGICGEIYSRSILNNAKFPHKYLPGPHRGILNLDEIKNADEVYLCECVIDTISLYCMGIKNATCTFGKGNVTDELKKKLSQQCKRVLITYDNDGDDDSTAEKTAETLANLGLTCERVILPADTKDTNAFLTAYLQENLPAHEIKEKFEALRRLPYSKNEQGAADELKLLTDNYGILEYQIADRLYKIKNFKRNVMSDLRVFLTVSRKGKKYFSNIDLSGEKSRKYFAENARERLEVSSFDVMDDLEQLASTLDEVQEKSFIETQESKPIPEEILAPPYEITEDRMQKTIEALKQYDYLTEILPLDTEFAGIVGEQNNKMLHMIAILSAITDNPIHILMVSRSGIGKSYIQKKCIDLAPEEFVSRITKTTEQALFYLQKDALKFKVISLDETKGVGSFYSFRTMMSEGKLELWVTEKDEKGRNKVTKHVVDGPCCILLSTTNLKDVDNETRSRMIVIFGDESAEQTARIRDNKYFMKFKEEGWEKRDKTPELIKKHKDMIWVLRNYMRDIEVKFEDDELFERAKLTHEHISTRRNSDIYMTVIEVIAKTRMFRKEIHEKNGRRYIVVDKADVALAEILMKKVLENQFFDLKGAIMNFYNKIVEYVDKNRGDIPRNEFKFTAREIRHYAGYGQTQTYDYLCELVRLEYLMRIKGANGKRAVYRLADNDINFGFNGNGN